MNLNTVDLTAQRWGYRYFPTDKKFDTTWKGPSGSYSAGNCLHSDYFRICFTLYREWATSSTPRSNNENSRIVSCISFKRWGFLVIQSLDSRETPLQSVYTIVVIKNNSRPLQVYTLLYCTSKLQPNSFRFIVVFWLKKQTHNVCFSKENYTWPDRHSIDTIIVLTFWQFALK